MSTAQDIINEALEMAGIIAVGVTPSNRVNVRALSALNDLIASWKSEGLDLQLSVLAANDTVYLDRSDELCLKTNAAVLFAEKWRLPIPPRVEARAISLLDNLIGKYLEADTEEMELPNILLTRGKADIVSGC